MREKSKHNALAARWFAAIYEFIQYAFVAFVHAVKSTQGNDGLGITGKLLYWIENFQTAFICFANLTISIQLRYYTPQKLRNNLAYLAQNRKMTTLFKKNGNLFCVLAFYKGRYFYE